MSIQLKGFLILGSNLPADIRRRDRFLIAAADSAEWRRDDENAGHKPGTVKLAIISKSWSPAVDVEYLYAQVGSQWPTVDVPLDFGDLLAGVAPFAIEHGLVDGRDGVTPVSIYSINTGQFATAYVPTWGKGLSYEQHASTDISSHCASDRIRIDFLRTAGSVCGALLPTGHVIDKVGSFRTTLIDNGKPLVIVRAEELGKSGYETGSDLGSDSAFRTRMEELRRAAGQLMKLGDVRSKNTPQVTLLAGAERGGDVAAVTLTPPKYESTSAGSFLEAITLGAACILPGSTAASMVTLPEGTVKHLVLEYPTGQFLVELELQGMGAEVKVLRSSLICTAQTVLSGEIVMPTAVLD
ncbi:MAG: PrpF domain-containing protein [Candidatus Acidiferrales bacterium]